MGTWFGHDKYNREQELVSNHFGCISASIGHIRSSALQLRDLSALAPAEVAPKTNLVKLSFQLRTSPLKAPGSCLSFFRLARRCEPFACAITLSTCN